MKRNKTYLICITIFFILFGCTDKETELKAEGYQVFSKYKLALKCPCALKLDTVDMNLLKAKYTDYTSFVCETFDKDSSIARFHLGFFINQQPTKESEIKEIINMMSKKDVVCKERDLGRAKAIQFNYDDFSQGLQIFEKKYTSFIAIESMNSKTDMEKIISTVKLY